MAKSRGKRARPEQPRISPRKKSLFAAVAVAGFFTLLELGLAIGGVEPLAEQSDPYVGFASSIPLFVENESGRSGELVTAPNKVRWFNRQRFMKVSPRTHTEYSRWAVRLRTAALTTMRFHSAVGCARCSLWRTSRGIGK